MAFWGAPPAEGRIDDSKVIGDAASLRSYLPPEERIKCHYMVHANDKPGSTYWDPTNNPYQGPIDKSDVARRDLAKLEARAPPSYSPPLRK